jgi:CheY-like chemotaxis protein
MHSGEHAREPACEGMSGDEILSLKMLIVSEVAPERELLRRLASQAAVPINVAEVTAAGDPEAAREALKQDTYDVVVFDSRMPKVHRQTVLDGIRAAPSRPLAILLSAAELKTREVLTDGLEVDGALAKPIDAGEARDLIAHCLRARMPNRVLVVDDSSTVRSVVRKVLQASCFRLVADDAQDGATAIAKAKEQRFDIVFLDCQMPGIDGFTTLAEFKRAHPDAKVVMITGMRDFRIEDRARAEGASDFLYKPFFARDIDAALSRVFGLMRARWN